MAANMRSFTQEIESKLDKVYKAGASKRFGFDEISNTSKQEVEMDPHMKSESDSKIGKIKS